MPKCKICGTRIDEGTTVCPSCGAKVASSSAVPDAGINADVATGTAKPRVSSTTQVIKTTCAHCGAEVIGEHRFCPQCGVNLKEAAEEKKAAATPQERRCPQCGSVVQENARFCPDCGKTLGTSNSAQAAPAQQTAPVQRTPAQQAAPAAKASSPAPATNSKGNTNKLRISLIPESLTESTTYFDSVQDFCSSPEVQNMSGKPTLGVDGELTEDELDTIANLVAQGRKVKTFNLSSCTNALQLKNEQFFTEELFERCAGLETVRLSDGRTLTQDSTKKAKPKKKRKGKKIAIGILGFIAACTVAGIIGNFSSSNTQSQHSYSSAPSNTTKYDSSSASNKSVPKNSDFVLVEGGSFMMGIDNSYYNSDGKHPVHSATVNSFYMCIHEVTQAEYQAITGTNPSQFKGENRPVERVSWYDAVEYCNRRSRAEGLTICYNGNRESGYSCNFNANGYRLPTETERQYAARGGKNHSPYKYSGSDDIDRVSWYERNSGKVTHDVMTKAPNVLGLYDMTGNVIEWYQDEYFDERFPHESYRLCGGGCANTDGTVFDWGYSVPYADESEFIGFRVVRSAR